MTQCVVHVRIVVCCCECCVYVHIMHVFVYILCMHACVILHASAVYVLTCILTVLCVSVGLSG